MKRVLTLVLALVLAASCFCFGAFAEADTAANAAVPDGFDFYSMTVLYEQPVVVGYKYIASADEGIVKKDVKGNDVLDEDGNPVYVAKGWVFDAPAAQYVLPAVEYTLNDAAVPTSQNIAYGVKALGNKKYNAMFYAVQSKDLGIESADIGINANYGLTNINDKSAISIISAAKLYGVTEYYDDAGTPNPNFARENGYFLDVTTDAEGNNLRIDINGYTIDANNIWHAKDGHRVEPFIEIDGTLVWIDLASRLDADGRVIDYHDITNQVLLDKGMVKLPAKYENLDVYDETFDYDGDGTPGKSKDKTAWKNLGKEKNNWYNRCDITLFTIDFQDTNGDGKKTEDDLPEYNNPAKTFTEADIMIQKDKEGQPRVDANGKPMLVYGSPKIGEPLTIVKIKGLTVEIDALGAAEGEETGNEIIITTGDLYENVKLANDYVAEHPEKKYTDGLVIGTAKCTTTKTAAVEETGWPSTRKSMEVVMAEGVEIPSNATLFFNFRVAKSQAENTKTFIAKKNYNLLSLNKGKLDVENLPDNVIIQPEEEKKGCGNFVGGGMAIVALAGAALVALRKKEH